MGKKAVVTGGAGFIGSWLCERLISEGYSVICIDNLGSGRKENIRHLLGSKKFSFVKHDIKDPIKIDGPVDYVFHLASRASPADFQKFAIDILLTNSLGTRNALEIAREKNARFLLASSSEVYGDPLEHPQKESYWGNVNPIGLRASYDEAKRFAEALTISFCRESGLDVRIARIFNTYGPRMRKDDGRVISTFVTQALEGEPITVFGDGHQTRSFCYITDMVDGLLRLMLTNNAYGQVVNLGGSEEITILDVARLIKKMTNSTSEIRFKPSLADDPRRRRPDLSKAKALLNWKPKVKLKDGLNRTIEYFKGSENEKE
jgi:nucleoside-diphosphate-sugar epimerase